MQDYLDSLSYDDLDCLELALSEDTTIALRFERTTDFEMRAVARLDGIIQGAPSLKDPVTVYRAYQAVPGLQDGATVEEAAFFAGSAVKPDTQDGLVVLEVMVPTEGKALQLDATTYVLPRGLKPTVGAPVPPTPASAAPGVLSLVDLDAQAVDEFFNKHHGRDGRFAPGKNGPGGSKLLAEAPVLGTPTKDASNTGAWPKFGGPHAVKMVAEARDGKTLGLFERRVKVDGIKVKSAYEVTANNGQKIKVYDLDGKGFGSFHKNVSDALVDMQNMYPMKPPRSLILMDRGTAHGAFAWMYPHHPYVFVNQKAFKDLAAGKFGNLEGKGHFMPSYKQKDQKVLTRYLMFHEYGHHYDADGPTVNKRRHGPVENERSFHEASALWKTPAIRQHLSLYGKSLQVEGYAEAFTEWHTSSGKTKNPAAIAYARNEGWYGSGTKAVRASGFIDLQLTAFEPWVFATEEDEATGDDLKDLLPFDPDEGPIIFHFFDKKPQVVGLPRSVEPTPVQVAEAKALIREVMDDLKGAERPAPSIQLTVAEEAGEPVPGIQLTVVEDAGEREKQTLFFPDMLLSLIDLNAENVDEFFNKNHDRLGRFGQGSNGRLSANAQGPGEGDGASGPNSGSTIDGVRGFDPSGKPIPGSDAWIEAHGMSRKVFEGRPYTRFEQGRNDPAIAKEYGDYPKDHRIFNKVAGQTGGYIMERHPAPGSPYGPILGEVRPDKRVVLDPSQHARRQTALKKEQERLAEIKKFSGDDLIKDRQVRLKATEDNLKKVKASTPDSIRKEASDRASKADSALKKAKATGDPGRIKEAQVEADRAKRGVVKADRTAKNWRPDKEVYDAETAVNSAKKRLERVKGNPESALATEIRSGELRVARKQNQFDKTSIKYTFPSQPGAASRLDVHQDPQNLKNLTEGKGRVYWAMEGCIKQDAVLTALKKEDPKAAIIGNPSVTLWQNGETQWVAKKYLHGREVVLLPDADGIKNPDVVRQAKGLQAALQKAGVGDVYIASPPLLKGKIENIKLRSGADDDRKGVDDHLGAGRGTLGEMTFSKQTVPSISLKEYTRAGGATGKKMNKNALASNEAALTAISSIAGQKGVAKIPKNMLSQASGLPPTTARDARNKLADLGLIKVEHVFDPDALGRGKRIQVMSDERIHQLVRQGVMKQPRTDNPFTDIDFDESPIISVIHDKHKARDDPPGTLSSINTWAPPKSFGGWTSPVTGMTASSYVVHTPTVTTSDMVVRTKAGAERYGVSIGQKIPVLKASGLLSTVLLPAVQPECGPSEPVVPESGLLETGTVPEVLSTVLFEPQLPPKSERSETVTLLPESGLQETGSGLQEAGSGLPEVEEFYNSHHDPKSGKFGAGKSNAGPGGSGPTEHDLLDRAATATKQRSLTGGRSSASVELLSGPNGKVVRKSNLPQDDVDREYLASRVAKALGAPVPLVARANAHTVVVDYRPGKVAGTFDRDIGRFLPLSRKEREASVSLNGSRELALFDIAVKNEDRHGGNFLIHRKAVTGIDHTTTFGGKAFLGVRPSKALEKRWKSSFSKADYEGALKKVKPLEGSFKKLGRTDWYDQMVQRLGDEAAK